MFDAKARRVIDPPLNIIGKLLAQRGVRANWVTVSGLLCGLFAAYLVVLGYFLTALVFVVLNRLADGLDGAIARADKKTDLGGFLDILCDFVFYGALPLAFALHNPVENALATAGLLFSFYLSGSSFLAFAVIAERKGVITEVQGQKSLYYLSGLAEGGETIAVFLAFCLFPQYFVWLAWGFAGICLISSIGRVAQIVKLTGAD
ncbi:CDP-alcohol phosphatidyltransferase family protein [Flexibacterium corallicola]|uniref:CDP-alcohol phosphatidyltransferase family protein n=1 Tax=Flexibacterium corallicola TaxID=3037259 RepID=UPI00286F1B10|nr:CDP-alcohol phosphatidyltransferase family protein [Pseudovibrio sp. M1P-2-3]